MDPSTRETMFSSGNQEWRTPPWLFQHLERLIGMPFVLDAAATDENTLCQNFYTKNENGLRQDWALEVAKIRERDNLAGGAVFVNCPYGHKESLLWAAKGYEESKKGCVVAMLLPARTDTEFFHRYVIGKAEVYFIEGRLKFSESDTGAPFPSIVAIWSSRSSVWYCSVIQQPDSLFKGRRPSTAWRRSTQ